MNEDLQLKLQAYLDGELPSGEAQAIRDLLVEDAHARDLLLELTNTRDVIVAHEASIKLPESREFYWSKIQREISRETSSGTVPVTKFSFMAWLRRALVPAGSLAAVAIAVMLSLPHKGEVADYTTTSGDTATFTYHNYATGTTLVWLDYGAVENDFSNIESDDTLDL
jgi:anti-sigma factor RsiW